MALSISGLRLGVQFQHLPFHEFLYASAHYRSDRVSSVMSVAQAHVSPRRKLGWNLQEAFMKLTGLLALIVIAGTTLAAQTFRGGIVGAVVDKSGAAISSAHVTVTSAETGLVRSTDTDAEGNFTFTELPLGIYEVSVVKPGFRTQTMRNVQVAVSVNQRANFELAVGDVSQIIEVNSEAPLIDTTGSSVGGTIEAAQVADLPVNGRDFIKILGLVPGSSADASAVSDSAGSFG